MSVFWPFLVGLALGGLAVWALVSYTAVNPVPFIQSKDAPTVQSIIARIERERLEAARSARADSSVRCA
ncbi:hypothetical protein IU474_16725 [Nocardia otitidiscaviarum]|uniref:hypothetical protein n=1 Tax=Nocardia otitidiscaviarum TaxID=1823 RepID=UPI0018960558|nr:hypothetical protein [Nocardia otitidiscaviarum]MBF6238695.1 hypothetical protein [Nocardia otitidiscaviarum]